MNKYVVIVIVAVVLGAVTGALGFKALSSSSSTEIEMKLPGGGSMKLNAKQDLKDPAAILSALFNQESSRSASIDWLKSKKDIFRLRDPDLVDAIHELCPDPRSGDSSISVVSRAGATPQMF
jgi:hypothetical protein